IGYARVSTSDQSLVRQVDELTEAGVPDGRIFSDVGSGAKDAKRPEWDLLLKTLREGDTLVVTELSRLGRSTSQLAALGDALDERGVSLRILNLGIDTGTAAGKLVYRIVAAVAEMERDLLVERTSSGLAAARARGRVGGRRRSYTSAQEKRARKLYDEGNLTVSEI